MASGGGLGGGLGRGTGRGLGILKQLKQKDQTEEAEKEEKRTSPLLSTGAAAVERPKLVSDLLFMIIKKINFIIFSFIATIW
jgi:hypothetical protein